MALYRDFFGAVLPAMLAFTLSGVYSIADGFFVGNALGDAALAAINVAYPVTALLLSVGTGLGMGSAVQYAIAAGGGDESGLERALGLPLLLLPLAGLLLTPLILACSPAVLILLGASGEIHALGEAYLRCIAMGAVFQVAGTGLVPVIRNLGGSLAATAAMGAGFLANIALDWLLVWRLSLGMSGAAWATVAGQGVSLGICVLFLLLRRPKARWDRESLPLIGKVLRVGLSPFGLSFSANFTLILVNRSAAAAGGSFAVMCYAPVSYVTYVVTMLFQGVGDRSQPLISLAHGRGDAMRVRRLFRLACLFSAAVGAACMAGVFLTRGWVGILFGASDAVARSVRDILPLFLLGFLPLSFAREATSFFYATEKNTAAYLLIYGEPLCLFLLLLFLPAACGITGTWLSVPLSQLLTGIFAAYLYRRISAGEASVQ